MKECPQCLFGSNLEFTRRLGYGGLYAEMIYNGRMLNDASGFYPVELDGLKGFGQSSDRIHFLPGKEYKWHVVAGSKITIRFLNEYKSELFRSNDFKGSFTSAFNYPYGRVEVVSDGEIKYLSLKASDALFECRKDVLDKMKELQPKTLRFPGGCFAEKYKWKEGLLPIEERPIISSNGKANLFSANEGYDGHEINIDDYMNICRYIGAEPEYTIRLTKNDPQDAADIVEYCNGDVSTPYGALRAERGHREPYNIKTWYIGNEVGFICDPEKAAELSDEFIEAMKKVDPTIKTVVTTGNMDDWDERFLNKAQMVDRCSLHSYITEQIPDCDITTAAYAAEVILRNKLERAKKRYSGHKIMFDEWNLQWGTLGSVVSGLYAAAVATLLIREHEELNIEGASYFAIVNEGAIRVYSDHAVLSPDGEILKRMANHAGGKIELNDDISYIKSIHDGYSYISVYNGSATEFKALSDICGEYELLTPDGDTYNITEGNGKVDELPPSSVLFVKC